MDNPELELFFYRRGEAEFSVALRFREPGNVTDQRFEAESVRIDLVKLATPALMHNPVEYGWELGSALFACPAIRAAFDHANARAQDLNRSLRVRLCADQRSRDDLHRLRWELLRRPNPEATDDRARADWMMAQPSLWFSRHLFSGDMRPVRLKPQADLTALVAIASPSDLDRWQPAGRPLAPIDVEGELATARQGLHPMRREELTPATGRVTMTRLLDALRREPDVLYLVCHGAIIEGEPRLMLEKDDGTAQMVSGARLVDELAGLRSLPRLVVLISCRSGGEGDSPSAGATSALAAIGPRLAEAGVAAVLAMQGDLRMDTARAFLPPFFAELQRSGQVDAAVTLGRAAVRDAPDAWVPVLTTRLVEGRVWFTGRLTIDGDAFGAWRQLVNQVVTGKCVPILGTGLLEPFIGTTREVANRLATANGYPMALSGREDLPQVAQFLETITDEYSTRVDVIKEMGEAVRRRWPELKLPPVNAEDPATDLRETLAAAWQEYQRDHPHEPHRYLVGKRQIKTIITTNPDDLLERALKAAGRASGVIPCRWDGTAGDNDEPTGPTPSPLPLKPTEDRPFIYQLFGHLDDPDSLIITEDDYFRFLTAVTRKQSQKKDVRRDDDLTDDLLRGTLASSALVFLGFRLTDWDFRTLFRLLMDQGGGNNRARFTHIAVQIDPEDGTHDEAVGARNFIEKLFRELVSTNRSGKIAVYWGGVEDFIRELDHQWSTIYPPAPIPPAPPSGSVV